jgi:hypothetical protein
MATANGGIVTVAYAPSRVHANLGGVPTTIEEETDYPFRGLVQFTIHPARPATFLLVLRLPGWADGGAVEINGEGRKLSGSGCSLDARGATGCNPDQAFYRIERTWTDGDRVTLTFQLKPRVTHWYRDAAVFERGPLVFSLPLGGHWSRLRAYSEKSADWQITPQKPWNYAVAIGECDASAVEHPIGRIPFDVQNPPVELRVEGKLDRQWTIEEHSAGPVPASPVISPDPLKTLTLVPYGAAKLRITAFPYLREGSRCRTPAKGGP